MRHTRLLANLLIASLALTGLIAGGVRVNPVAAEMAAGAFTIALEAGDYVLRSEEDGQTRIQMARDFGYLGAPGEPELPGRVFFVALPPGAQVTDVRFETPGAVTLAGRCRITPVAPAAPGPGDERAEARWGATRARVYASDDPYPGQVGEYLGQSQWRRYIIAQVAFQPFSYQPQSGTLRFHPTLAVTFEYRLADPDSPAWREVQRLRDDRVLDDLIAPELVNFDQARAWYDDASADPLVTAASLYDYVIIVQNETMAAAVAPFKTWKESLGHTVYVATLAWIHANYSGVDVAEEVWNFLHDKYPSSEWGIRYVMLVGDLQVIPTRRVYYADTEWGLRSDHFYAKLSGGDTSAQVWNHDGDVRWGELQDDEMTVMPDVLVGRIPLNNATEVAAAVQAMIAFEQDSGDWKHAALLAGGYADISSATNKTDDAVLMETIRTNLLDPNAWDYTRIYEQSGLGTSTYTPPPDYYTSTANVIAAWNGQDHGLVVLSDHGDAGGLSGVIWQNDVLTTTGQVDEGEIAWSDLFLQTNVASLTNTHPAIVELLGCSSIILVGPPWPDPDQTMATPGSYTDNTGSELLAHGAAAGVVGFYSPGPYTPGWSKPDDGGSSTIGYYFTENLIENHYTLGWSLFETKIRYTAKFWNNNYQPYHWAFNLFGDPSMVLEGYDTSAKGRNKTIYTGPVYAYGTDNADDGDMYVAVSTHTDPDDGEIKVYKSTDHGETWNPWATVTYGSSIQAVDVIVGEWGADEFASRKLHVFFTAANGTVWDNRIDLTTVLGDAQLIASEGSGNEVWNISAARDPVPTNFNLYVAWDVTAGASHQVKVARSAVNGGAWTSPFTYENYQQSHIDAGPGGHVYLVAAADAFPNDVNIMRSLDSGASWGGWTNLTTGDSGDYHGAPVVAASTDGAIPTVWAAYNYYKPVALGAVDLRFAYSQDGGSTWTKNQILSAEKGVDELMPDMVGYRADASRWMNIAYHHSQSTGTNVIWRWVSGSLPNNWWAPRLMNDHATHPALGPQVIYSPGAAATGSGVVYPGNGSPINNLYFAAPWLSVTTDAPLLSPAARSSPAGPAAVSPQVESVQHAAVAQAGSPGWAFTGQAGQAFRIAGLAQGPGGTLYAAATTSEADGANMGRVFRSDDSGATWEPTAPLPLAWWLDSILVTRAGALLVGGMKYDPGNPGAGAQGVVYRSINGGDSWAQTGEWPGTIVHALLQRANGDIVAATGPGAIFLFSPDDGEHWYPLGLPPNGLHVYALLETGGGALYAGGTRTDGSGVVYRLGGGGVWESTGALDNTTSVYALLEGPGGVLYAGVASTDGAGRVFRSLDGGETWQPSQPLGESRAVRALLAGPEGKLYAGLDMEPGRFTSYVYLSEDSGDTWQDAGYLYMADAVHDFLFTSGGTIYAASGDTYGVIFRTEVRRRIYLPLVLRNH